MTGASLIMFPYELQTKDGRRPDSTGRTCQNSFSFSSGSVYQHRDKGSSEPDVALKLTMSSELANREQNESRDNWNELRSKASCSLESGIGARIEDGIFMNFYSPVSHGAAYSHPSQPQEIDHKSSDKHVFEPKEAFASDLCSRNGRVNKIVANVLRSTSEEGYTSSSSLQEGIRQTESTSVWELPSVQIDDEKSGVSWQEKGEGIGEMCSVISGSDGDFDAGEESKKSTLSEQAKLPSSQYKGVVPQPNGRWGAQIYEKHQRVWLGTFNMEDDAAKAYDRAALKFRGRDAITNFRPAGDRNLEAVFLNSHTKEQVVDMLRRHTYDEELDQSRKLAAMVGDIRSLTMMGSGASTDGIRIRGSQEAVGRGGKGAGDDDKDTLTRGRGGMSPGNGSRCVSRELLFEKAVTPSDVGKLNRLVIPKQHAQRCFPLTGDGSEKGLLLNFEDSTGKMWRFRYSYWNSSQSYVLTKGWSRFVKEMKLDAGDIVIFERSDDQHFYISCRRRPTTQRALLDIGLLHQPSFLSHHQQQQSSGLQIKSSPSPFTLLGPATNYPQWIHAGCSNNSSVYRPSLGELNHFASCNLVNLKSSNNELKLQQHGKPEERTVSQPHVSVQCSDQYLVSHTVSVPWARENLGLESPNVGLAVGSRRQEESVANLGAHRAETTDLGFNISLRNCDTAPAWMGPPVVKQPPYKKKNMLLRKEHDCSVNFESSQLYNGIFCAKREASVEEIGITLELGTSMNEKQRFVGTSAMNLGMIDGDQSKQTSSTFRGLRLFGVDLNPFISPTDQEQPGLEEREGYSEEQPSESPDFVLFSDSCIKEQAFVPKRETTPKVRSEGARKRKASNDETAEVSLHCGQERLCSDSNNNSQETKRYRCCCGGGGGSGEVSSCAA